MEIKDIFNDLVESGDFMVLPVVGMDNKGKRKWQGLTKEELIKLISPLKMIQLVSPDPIIQNRLDSTGSPIVDPTCFQFDSEGNPIIDSENGVLSYYESSDTTDYFLMINPENLIYVQDIIPQSLDLYSLHRKECCIIPILSNISFSNTPNSGLMIPQMATVAYDPETKTSTLSVVGYDKKTYYSYFDHTYSAVVSAWAAVAPFDSASLIAKDNELNNYLFGLHLSASKTEGRSSRSITTTSFNTIIKKPSGQKVSSKSFTSADETLDVLLNLNETRLDTTGYDFTGTIGGLPLCTNININDSKSNSLVFGYLPALVELWIINPGGMLTNLTLTDTLSALTKFICRTNVNLTGTLLMGLMSKMPNATMFVVSNNNLADVVGVPFSINALPKILNFGARASGLSQAAVDGILAHCDTIDVTGKTDMYVVVSNNAEFGDVAGRLNAAPSAAGLIHKASLESKGWYVETI